MDPITRQGISVAAGAGGGEGLYVDDVFSTFLYEASGSTQTITNGIDLAGEGGMVWIKNRDSGGSFTNNTVNDSERIGTYGHKSLYPNLTQAEFNPTAASNAVVTSFNSNGFTRGGNLNVSNSGGDYVSWTFRKAPGFFDVVTYTGNGSNRTISHSLGSVPGMILIKMTSSADSWVVYHRSTGATHYTMLNSTNAAVDNDSRFNDTEPTASVFTVGTDNGVNQNGRTFVAYLFAHDDQSFGTNSDESIIKCGSFSYTGGTPLEVNLGWEAQWVLVKKTNGTDSWFLTDTMRGMINGDGTYLQPNTSNAEGPYGIAGATSTGFIFDPGTQIFSTGSFIYMAIRRPHKPPTAGTDVFTTKLWTGNGSSGTRTITGVGFTPDLVFGDRRSSGGGPAIYDRLRGKGRYLQLDTTQAEGNTQTEGGLGQASFDVDGGYGAWNNNGLSYVGWLMRRAPGFFDVVAYTGTGSTRTITHNLNSAPEMMLFKRRSLSNSWIVYHKSVGATHYLMLNLTNSADQLSLPFNDTDPTSSVFTLGPSSSANANGHTFIAYLFATLDGISKVGSYTGTGSNIDVDCGFTAGARFVLIKRTDSTGDWYVWDTTRGIVSGNDPYLLLNSTAAETTNTDYIDPLNAGFTVTSSAPAALNTSGGTYIFLAIA